MVEFEVVPLKESRFEVVPLKESRFEVVPLKEQREQEFGYIGEKGFGLPQKRHERYREHGEIRQDPGKSLTKEIVESIPFVAPMFKLDDRETPLDGNIRMAEAKKAADFFLYSVVGGEPFAKLTKDITTRIGKKVLWSQGSKKAESQVGRSVKEILGIRSAEEKATLKAVFGTASKSKIDKITKSFAQLEAETSPIMLGNYTIQKAESAASDIAFSRYWTPKKNVLLDAEQRTGIPVYSKIWKPVEDAAKKMRMWKSPIHKEVSDLFKGFSKEQRIKVTHILEGTHKGPVSKKEKHVATEMRKLYDILFKEFDIDPEIYLKHYSPRMRALKNQAQREEYISEFAKLKEMGKFTAKFERTGELFPREDDAFKLAIMHVNAGAKEKFMKVPYNTAKKMVDSIKNLPSQTGKAVNNYLSDIYGYPRETSRAARQFVQNFKDIYNSKIPFEKFKMDDAVLERIVNTELQLTYGGAMAFRPVTVIRNMAQTYLLTFPTVGAKSFYAGLKKGFTKEGFARARQLGILYEDALPVPYGEDFGVFDFLGKVTKKGLWGFRKQDSVNRVIAFHAGEDKVLRHGKKLMKTGDVKKFINGAELDWYHPTIIKEDVLPLVKKALKEKDFAHMEKLAETMGIHNAEATQFIYRKANSPDLMQSSPGKIFGQFGTWPAYYKEWVKSTTTRGTTKNKAKRIARYIAMAETITETGDLLGVDIDKWVYYHPLMWGGAPAGAALTALKDLIDGSEYDKAAATNTLQQYGSLHAPGYLAVKGLVDAADETSDEDAVKRALGFRPEE